MTKGFFAKDYNLSKTGVKFSTSDSDLEFVFDKCEELCAKNIYEISGMRVMQEGAKYCGVWLETQPMAGEMYAKRDMEVALNNCLVFMLHQRRDGRMSGAISFHPQNNGFVATYSHFQGDFFTPAAYKMAYYINRDKVYLQNLYEAIKSFDEYMWRYRDSDGDGCLETWCIYDTGDDNSTRFLAGDALGHNGAWCGEKPPSDRGNMPYESAEMMAYSYSHRATLAKISDMLGNDEGDYWRKEAEKVKQKIEEYLWREDKKAVYDRDCNNEFLDTLCMFNIKCMYHGAFSQRMADEFIKCHLLNREEFFTPLPLPAIAANDPAFYVNNELNNLSPEMLKKANEKMCPDALDNSWSGAVQGLSVQRSLDALINYGHHAESALIGELWLDNLCREKYFTQQYNPMTGEHAKADDGYGPTMLAALQYIAYLYGVDFSCDTLVWSAVDNDKDTSYTQTLFGAEYTLERKNKKATAYKNGKMLFAVSQGVRVITDLEGNLVSLVGLSKREVALELEYAGVRHTLTVKPNEHYSFDGKTLVLDRSVPFDYMVE